MFIVYTHPDSRYLYATYALCYKFVQFNKSDESAIRSLSVIETTDNWFGDLNKADLDSAIDIELQKQGFKLEGKRLVKEMSPYMLVPPWEIVTHEILERKMAPLAENKEITSCFPVNYWERLFLGKEDLTVRAAMALEAVLGLPSQFFINLWQGYYTEFPNYEEIDGKLIHKERSQASHNAQQALTSSANNTLPHLQKNSQNLPEKSRPRTIKEMIAMKKNGETEE